MATADDVLNQARSHIGYTEGPNNDTVFGDRTGFPHQPWCGSWVNCVMADANQHGEPSVVYTPSGAAAYRRLGGNRWVERNGPVQPGDVVFFDWGGSTNVGATDHVGLVEAVLPGGQLQTIEGNTSPSNAGSQSNGDGVYRRVRNRNNVVGFGRPAYSGQPVKPVNPQEAKAFRQYVAAVLKRDIGMVGLLRPGMSGGNVQILQKAVNLAGGKSLTQDGQYGPATTQAVKDLQHVMKLETDGITGPKTVAALQFLLAQIEANG